MALHSRRAGAVPAAVNVMSACALHQQQGSQSLQHRHSVHARARSATVHKMVKVFVTGGTGFIGSRLVQALVDAQHEVTVLSRGTASSLDQLNVKIVSGSFQDLDTVAAAAAQADAVYHLGFDHDFSKVAEACKQDLGVVRALIGALSGSGKLLVNTSVTVAAGDTGNALGQETQLEPSPRTESEVITVKVGVINTRPALSCTQMTPCYTYCIGN